MNQTSETIAIAFVYTSSHHAAAAAAASAYHRGSRVKQCCAEECRRTNALTRIWHRSASSASATGASTAVTIGGVSCIRRRRWSSTQRYICRSQESKFTKRANGWRVTCTRSPAAPRQPPSRTSVRRSRNVCAMLSDTGQHRRLPTRPHFTEHMARPDLPRTAPAVTVGIDPPAVGGRRTRADGRTNGTRRIARHRPVEYHRCGCIPAERVLVGFRAGGASAPATLNTPFRKQSKRGPSSTTAALLRHSITALVEVAAA